MQNPKTAIDAIMQAVDADEDAGGTRLFHLHPLTIARYALLDLIDSPFVTRQSEMTLDQVIPSIYVMAQPARSLAKYSSKNVEELKADAFEWSETLSPEDLAIALNQLADAVLALSKLAPEVVENSKKKASG